jgi:hypothetical protein
LKAIRHCAFAAAFLVSTACGSKQELPAPPPEGAHQHRAPHGGTLVELGSEFAHIELVLDSTTGTLTAYVLDGEAEESVRIQQPALKIAMRNPATGAVEHFELAARADLLTGETIGDTSEFSFTSPTLRGRAAVEGAIEDITVKGGEFHDVPF